MRSRFFISLTCICLLLAACAQANAPTPAAEPAPAAASPHAVTAEGTLYPASSAELAFAQGGVVAAVFAQPGDRLAAGDVIAQLIGYEIAQAELAAARVEQTLAQQARAALQRNALLTASQAEQALRDAQKAYVSEAGRWSLGRADNATDLELSLDDYVAAEKAYQDARTKLDLVLAKDEADRERRDAQDDLDAEAESLAKAYADLSAAVAQNSQPLDPKLAGLLKAVASLEVAREMQARLDAANLDPDLLAAADARLEAAAAHLAAAEAAQALYELRAPGAGVLLSLDLAAGEAVLPMAPVAFLADPARWIVETKDLAEIDAVRVTVGDPALIKLDAFPGEAFAGQVTQLDPVGREYLGDMTYLVTITLNEFDPRFLWNMTATVTVETE